MANLISLCNEIEQFIQNNDQQTIDQLINWFEVRLKPQDQTKNSSKTIVDASQIFRCNCGQRFSFRLSLNEISHENKSIDESSSSPKRFKSTINELQNNGQCSTNKLLICNDCQIRLHTRETFIQHCSMHQQGFHYCKTCFQFYKLSNEINDRHECDRSKMLTNSTNDDLNSLEQLIPPENTEQQETSNLEYLPERQSSTAARLTRFGLPILTDSIVEIVQPDGKRQYRCPLCLNSYVNRSGLNRHYITHSSQDLWKVECQFCGKRYSRKDSLKHHMKTQHAQYLLSDSAWLDQFQATNEKFNEVYRTASRKSLQTDEEFPSPNDEKQEEIVLVN